jgi:hypothetical protein
MNPAKVNAPQTVEFGVACDRSYARFGCEKREHTLKFFFYGAWSGEAVDFPPCRNFFNLSGGPTRYFD